jgi:glycosyltransferase involved in cell wall biosynthesis
MKILINATNLAEAGARSVAMNFLGSCPTAEGRDDLVVYAPPARGFEALAGPGTVVRTLPRSLRGPLRRYLASGGWWRQVIREERPDVVFNMGNCALPVPVTQVTLFHWPHAIYPDTEVWRRMRTRDWVRRKLRYVLFRRRLPFTTVMIAQTETAARRLRRYYGIPEVYVVPNAVSLQKASEHVGRLAILREGNSRIRLLCFTRYYYHKNLEILLPVAKRLKEVSAPFQIVLTLGRNQHANVGRMLRDIRRWGLEDYIHNIGPVEMRDVPALYASVDALLLPTLLESFSQTYVEAMHFGKPIFTSDRDFAHDVCGPAAFYFDPNDAGSIVRTLTEAYETGEAIAHRVEQGKRRAAAMPDWHTVGAMFLCILRRVAEEHGPSRQEKPTE